MKQKPKLLFICQEKRSFVSKDIEILGDFAEVEVVVCGAQLFGGLKSTLKNISKCKLVFIWFLGKHSVVPLLLSRLFGKKVVVVAGGWDVANCPNIDYGLMREGLRAWFCRLLFSLADYVIAVSESNFRELNNNAKIRPPKAIKVVHGFEYNEYVPISKEPIVLTVGVLDKINLKRKGLEDFVKTAALLPEFKFVHVGKCLDDEAGQMLKEIATPNLSFMGYISQKDLTRVMKQAKVYAQLSYHEAFGCSLAEAMLYECIPVVSNQYALPEVAGKSGFVAEYGDVAGIATQIKKAMQSKDIGPLAKKHISECYSLSKRADALRTVICKCLETSI